MPPRPKYNAKKAATYSKDKKNPFADNPYIRKGFSSSNPSVVPDYKTGDQVIHFKFGTGTVTSLSRLEEEEDYEVVVHFKNFGNRKFRTSFAKLRKI